MRNFQGLKPINQSGFDHVLVAVAFAVIMALGGTYYLITSRANSWSGALQLSYSQSYCMENMSNANVAYSTVELNACSASSEAQHWAFQNDNNGSFQIVAAASSACVDDYQGKIGTSTNSPVYLETLPCSSSDQTEFWHWGGTGDHQLINQESGGCINLPSTDISNGGKGTPQTLSRLTVFSCSAASSGNASNAEWVEGINSAIPTKSANSTAPSGTTGEIRSSRGSNLCVTAGSTVTLRACQNTAAQQWVQVSTAAGGSTEQFYNVATSSYLGLNSDNTGAAVVDTASSGNALWTASLNSNGSNQLIVLTSGNGNLNYCLSASNGTSGAKLVIDGCVSGATSQSFTLSTQPSDTSTAAARVTFTTTSPSPSQSEDIMYLLSLLQQKGQTVTCTSLSAADRTACESIFSSN